MRDAFDGPVSRTTFRAMPVSYAVDRAARIAIVTMSGAVTFDDCAAYFRATANDPEFSNDLDRIIVATDASAFPTSAEVSDIAQHIRQRTVDPALRFAVVVNTPLAIGMANMFLIQAGLGERYELFADTAAATDWLMKRRQSSD